MQEVYDVFDDSSKVITPKETKLKLDGVDAVELTYNSSTSGANCGLSKPATIKRILAVNKGIHYWIEIHYFNQGKDDYSKIFEQTLSTFKFLDQLY